MSADDAQPALERAEQRHFRIVNGHLWRAVKTTNVGEHGYTKTRVWRCDGCGKESRTRNDTECESPALWVALGAPGDGLGWCRKCETAFVFEYGKDVFYEHTCPCCGSLKWYRDDDPDAEPEEVLTLDER